MKFYVKYDSDPFSTIFDLVEVLVVGTSNAKETNDLHDAIAQAPVRFYRDRPHVFVFKSVDLTPGLVLEAEIEEDIDSTLISRMSIPGKDTTYCFKIAGELYDELIEISETDFFAGGLCYDLMAGTSAAPATARDIKPRCKHEKGSTPIFGRWICKFCGENLD